MTRLLIGPVLRHVGTNDATVWVETDAPCEVEILGCRESTWTVSGHHYALVHVEGLEPGTSTPYEVTLDGEPVWPMPSSDRPPSRIRTQGGAGPLRFAFGSCRYGRASAKLSDSHFDVDSLAALSRLMTASDESQWPNAFFMLGDQVYADETSVATERRISARRDITTGAKDQVADFEEYTWLYLESWTDPDVRWLMSVVPSSMIFDDHDIRDDWNTSHLWREDMQKTDWWEERIVGGLASYWVYQHLGNLSPDELRDNELYQRVRGSAAGDSGDAEPLLREFALHADAEADGAKGTRWSFRRDFGRTRLLMIDSRCGRILAENARMMVSESEFAWIDEQMAGDYDHLLIGTSLPWLMARALHDLEAWDEVLAAGQRGARWARWGEKMRRAADLEHWAAFSKSFDRLGTMIAAAARGEYAGVDGRAPATVCVLSGDVHHAYVAEANFERPVDSRVYQLTCSPLHNYVPAFMKVTFRIAWSRLTERAVRRLLNTVADLPPVDVSWKRLCGPFFGNEVATLVIEGRHAEMTLHQSAAEKDPDDLVEVARVVLAR